MPSEVILPRVDMDMTTGKISKWLVAPGTAVSKGQPLFEIETDKATMEIEAEAAGTIRDLAEAGAADIPVGSVVAWIFAENEAATTPRPAEPEAHRAPDSAGPAPAETEAVRASVPAPASNGAGAPARRRATPLARRIARMDGIDLGSLTGSGPRGRIQAADVSAPARAPRPEAPTAAVEARPAPPRPAPEPARSAVPRAVADTSTSAVAPSGPKRLRDGTGRPLLLVHGFGAEANGWRPFLQGPRFGRPVYAIDLPGHGAAPVGGVANFDDLVEAAEAALGGLDGVDVVAHSLGGALMTAVAARGEVDLRSLLLIAPAGLGPDINGAFIQGFLAATSEASLAPWMAELVADPAALTPAFVRATLKGRTGTDRVEAQRRLAAALFPDGTQSFSIRADLARLRIPARVVFGTADRIIPARHATGLPGLVALHLLPGVGHMPHLEAPETVAAILAQITGV